MLSFDATFLFVFISFAVFMVLMKLVYFDPMLRIKYARERKLVEDREAAASFAAEYAKLRDEYEGGLRKARLEAHKVVQEIRQQAKATASQTVTQARQDAQAELDRQMTELAAWREDTYRQMEGERAALARTIIQKVTAGNKVQAV
jgi:F-type H+-transporting ATPase subunit b